MSVETQRPLAEFIELVVYRVGRSKTGLGADEDGTLEGDPPTASRCHVISLSVKQARFHGRDGNTINGATIHMPPSK